MDEVKLDQYSEPGLYVEEYMCFLNGKIQFHQGEESKQNEEAYGHSAFDKIVEYDIADSDNMIEALEKHYEEKQYLCTEITNSLEFKLQKLLNLVFSFYSDKTNFYWEDSMIELFNSSVLTKKIADKLQKTVKTKGYQPKKVLYKTLSDLVSYFNHFGIKTITDYCL